MLLITPSIKLYEKLEPARMDASTRSECFEGTSTDILQSIIDRQMHQPSNEYCGSTDWTWDCLRELVQVINVEPESVEL